MATASTRTHSTRTDPQSAGAGGAAFTDDGPSADRAHASQPPPGRVDDSVAAPSGPSTHTIDGLPLMLTVAEAAVVLRVSRTTAYKLAEDWRTSGGREGLPVVKLGRRLVVRRVDLAKLVGLSPC